MEGEREALQHCNVDNDGDCQDSPHGHLPPPIRLVCTNQLRRDEGGDAHCIGSREKAEEIMHCIVLAQKDWFSRDR